MNIRRFLKKSKAIYKINAYLKVKQFKNRKRTLDEFYNSKIFEKGIEYSVENVYLMYKGRLGTDKNIYESEAISTLWVGASKVQDYSGFIQALRRKSMVYEFIDDDGNYRLKLQNEKFDPEIINTNDVAILEYIKNLQASGVKIDILMGQFWANCISEHCLIKIQNMGIITVCISMDDRLPQLWMNNNGKNYGTLGLVRGLDLILTTSSEYCVRYMYHGCPALYWPLGSDPNLFKPSIIKDIDVSFIGNKYGIREEIVNDLIKAGINISAFGKGWVNGPVGPLESADIFSRSKIILGIGTVAHCKDVYTLKLRDFDATMAGSLYITHRNTDLCEIYREGIEAEYYGDTNEAAQKIKFYLNNPKLIDDISQNAYLKSRSEYTWDIRIDEVYNFLLRVKDIPKVVREGTIK